MGRYLAIYVCITDYCSVSCRFLQGVAGKEEDFTFVWMGKMGKTDVKNIISTADRVDKTFPAWYALVNFLRKGECVMKMNRTAMSMLMPMCMCRMSMRCCADLRCAD